MKPPHYLTGALSLREIATGGRYRCLLVYRDTGERYDVAKARLPATALGLGLAAACSGAVGSLVVTPVERLKVVMQAASSGDFAGGGADCLRTIVAEDGVGGLLSRGLGATFLREVPAYASPRRRLSYYFFPGVDARA